MLLNDINKFCEFIGKNPLFVQGAGGNVSIKKNNILLVKASGTWLSDAMLKNIFVPVDLNHLKDNIDKKNFSVVPIVNNNISLKPSIETLMHALINAKIVLHLHSIDILSILVRKNVSEILNDLLDNDISWDLIPYKKPGAKLAESIYKSLQKNPKTQVLFLKNHGVVISANSLKEVIKIFNKLNVLISIKPVKLNLHESCVSKKIILNKNDNYLIVNDDEINNLVYDDLLFSRLKSSWCLYPDHIVFLGQKPFIYNSLSQFNMEFDLCGKLPDLIFIKDYGIFFLNKINLSKKVQLRCYYDVIVRQDNNDCLDILSSNDIKELVDWDAESYRINLSK